MNRSGQTLGGPARVLEDFVTNNASRSQSEVLADALEILGIRL